MKKKLILSAVCLMVMNAFGQTQDEIGDNVVSAAQITDSITTSADEKAAVPVNENLTTPVAENTVAPVAPPQPQYSTTSVKEDTTQITTINDIIQMQQEVTNMNFRDSHYRSVWGRKSYLNLSYNTTTLTPDGVVPTGVASYNGGIAPAYKSNWGASLQVGRSYALHKNPISNILQFNFDYTFIDLSINHFKAENDGRDLYDSRNVLPGTDDKLYTPWNLEKYDFNYGMSVGPSITVAPFTHTKYAGLHHLKFNAYFHIGYHAALLLIKKNSDADLNQEGVDGYNETNHKNMDKRPKLDFGHGLITSFGFSMTWKAIGIGYEHRSGKLSYKPLDDNIFGDEKYKFKSSTNRIFIQFRM